MACGQLCRAFPWLPIDVQRPRTPGSTANLPLVVILSSIGRQAEQDQEEKVSKQCSSESFASFFIDSLWISHQASGSHSFLHSFPSSLYLANPHTHNVSKFVKQQNLKKKRITKYPTLEAVAGHSEWHSIPFSPYILTYLQVFIAMSHWSGSRPAVFSTPRTLGSHWGSSWMDILLLSCVVEILYFWVCRVDFFHMRQQIIGWVNDEIRQIRVLALGLGGCKVSRPVSSPLSSRPRWALQHCPS